MDTWPGAPGTGAQAQDKVLATRRKRKTSPYGSTYLLTRSDWAQPWRLLTYIKYITYYIVSNHRRWQWIHMVWTRGALDLMSQLMGFDLPRSEEELCHHTNTAGLIIHYRGKPTKYRCLKKAVLIQFFWVAGFARFGEVIIHVDLDLYFPRRIWLFLASTAPSRPLLAPDCSVQEAESILQVLRDHPAATATAPRPMDQSHIDVPHKGPHGT